MRLVRNFLQRETAATTAEYAVMLALILLAVLAGIGSVSSQTGGMWGGIVTNLTNAGFIGGS